MKLDIVVQGYNKIAKDYLADRSRLKSGSYIQKLIQKLPKKSLILDLGCGAGIPVDDILIKAGHEVIGIDNSIEQIKLARKMCPKGQYLLGDIRDLKAGEYSVQAVIAMYAMFHVPRSEQDKVLAIIASYLDKGGLLLLTMGDREFEGEHTLYGEVMWSSQWGTKKNLEMVRRAGFTILLDEMDNSGGERHQIILAQKR